MSFSTFADTRAVIESHRPIEELAANRNILALYAKALRADSYNTRFSLLNTLCGVADDAAKVVSDVIGAITYPLQPTRRRKPSLQFGPIILRPLRVASNRYSFKEPYSDVSANSIELHLDNYSDFTASEVLEGLGDAARHIGEVDALHTKRYITAVSYPELIGSAVRMGMLPVDVAVYDPEILQAIRVQQAVFHALNGRNTVGSFNVAGAYLPTTRFVERFSRFAHTKFEDLVTLQPYTPTQTIVK